MHIIISAIVKKWCFSATVALLVVFFLYNRLKKAVSQVASFRLLVAERLNSSRRRGSKLTRTGIRIFISEAITG